MPRAMSPSVRVIVNADDLGLSTVVNEAIVEWAEAGIVTSTSAMGAAPCTDAEVVRRLNELEVSIGVHCNLSQFSPLTEPEPLRPLLASDGTFGGLVRSVDANGALREAVVEELRAQIAVVAALGADPSHLDSHHHDHFTLWMMRVFRRLRLSTGIGRVRPPLSNREIGGRRHQLVRARARDVQRHVFGFRTPDHLCDLAYLGSHGIDELRSMSGTVEVMCHPGADRPGERKAGEALRDAPWVQLVDYRTV